MTFCLTNTLRLRQTDEELLARWQKIFELTYDYQTRQDCCRVLRIGWFKITSRPEPGCMYGPENYRGFHFTARIYFPWIRVSRWF